jgi:hypothetical protein
MEPGSNTQAGCEYMRRNTMRLRYIMVACLAGVLLSPAAVVAGTGKIKVVMRDGGGRTMNGKATAKKGSVKKTCKTAAGTCTINRLSAGTWSVSAASTSGALKGGPHKASAKDGKTTTVNIVVRKSDSGKRKLSKSKGKAGATGSPKKARKASKKGDKKAKPKKKFGARNLAKGKRKVVKGSVRNPKGNTLNGKVTVRRGSRVVGYSKTAGGAYKIYDLPYDTYTFQFVSTGGKKASVRAKVESKKIKTINFVAR